MVVYGKERGFDRAIHNIENAPFRTKFDKDFNEMEGNIGIGSISDFEPQPLMVRSHHGTYAITTVGKINNAAKLTEELLSKGHAHFLEMSGGDLNPTELVAYLVDQKDNLVEGIRYAQGVYAARDLHGRTPVSCHGGPWRHIPPWTSMAGLPCPWGKRRAHGASPSRALPI